MCNKLNTSIGSTMPVYVMPHSAQGKFVEQISPFEFNVLRRLRQLRNEGATIAVVQLSEMGPKVCKVGKPEG